jgi:hypothetical protein
VAEGQEGVVSRRARKDGDLPLAGMPGPLVKAPKAFEDALAASGDARSASPASAKQQTFGFDVTHGFLGEEFLLWLWFRWETDGGEFTLGGGRVIGLAIDDLLQFAPNDDDDHTQTLRHGLPTKAPEARTALREGHRVAKARLIIAEGSRQWTATIEGATLRCSAKLPEDAEECESDVDRTADRSANWLALHEIVAALFARFRDRRVGGGWNEEAGRMAAWMAK